MLIITKNQSFKLCIFSFWILSISLSWYPDFFTWKFTSGFTQWVLVEASSKYHRTCKKVENISTLVTNIKDLNV
jgi:hypothetical protein